MNPGNKVGMIGGKRWGGERRNGTGEKGKGKGSEEKKG
jgi:hypothetical protein